MNGTIEVLCRALETGDVWTWPDEDEYQFDLLVSQALVSETRPASFWTCPHCQQYAKITRLIDGRLYADCEDGRTFIEADQIRRWKANTNGVIGFLLESLNLSGRQKELVDGAFHYLGRYGRAPHDFPIWFLSGGDDAGVLELACLALEQRSPDEAGIVLTTSRHALSQRWPRGSRTVMLHDALKLDGGLMAVNSAVLVSRAPSTGRATGQPGRTPKNSGTVLEEFIERIAAGSASRMSCKQEAIEILRLEQARYGDKARKLGYIQKILGPSWRAWKESEFRRDFTG